MRFAGRCLRVLPIIVAMMLAMPAMASILRVDHGRFHQVPVHQPDGPAQRVVIWFHADGHGTLASDDAVEALRREGALVVDVDIAHLHAALQREGNIDCAFGAGDVENFSRWLQAYLHLPGYRLPLLGGEGEGAVLAHAVAAQAGPGTFAGLLTTEFCPHAPSQRMVCVPHAMAGRPEPAALPVPWLVAEDGGRCAATAAPFLQAASSARSFRRSAAGDAVPGLVAAARVMGDAPGIDIAPPPEALQGLPVVEVPAARPGDTLAIFMSGDGGWAGLDKDVAAALAAQGVAVVGVDSLRYFWSARTPESVAADLARIATHYRRQWQRPRLLLIGFSQGADVLPASINRLDPAMRAQVDLIALLSVGRRADFEFHVSNWLGGGDDGLPIAPEVARLPAARVLCLYGRNDADALCPDLPGNGGVRRIELPGDHHFNGDHDRLAREILAAAPR